NRQPRRVRERLVSYRAGAVLDACDTGFRYLQEDLFRDPVPEHWTKLGAIRLSASQDAWCMAPTAIPDNPRALDGAGLRERDPAETSAVETVDDF
ncbi:MAG: hypothetical protein AAF368_10205, partial [Planctomycetota bacterium]